ncbi:uncharacterized protein BDV17DRAFT_21055 [Aspergillus undulatus]|uniref:uncharacterized protein n=1 Tax=Aspergillus undulatus TaxID=1810928 RepID=UPI003CCDFD1E
MRGKLSVDWMLSFLAMGCYVSCLVLLLSACHLAQHRIIRRHDETGRLHVEHFL